MFHRLHSVLFLLLLFAALAVAQDNHCTTKLADLPRIPELCGFTLGMTFDQVKTRVPQVVFGRPDDLGLSKTSINPDFDPRIDKSSFTDVRTVSLDFLDGRLSSLWIGYQETFKWKTLGEFVNGISQALAVPNEWTTKGRAQQLKCADFELDVSMIADGPSLHISDLAAAETWAARRQAQADEAEAREAAADQTPVVGDAQSKIYYAPDCQSLKSVAQKNRVKFKSADEAEKAGYTRSSKCE
jgi:Metal binding domain of Ada